MPHIRPHPVSNNESAYFNNVGASINANNIIGGSGVLVHKDSSGTHIKVNSEVRKDTLVFQGKYLFSNSYMVDDVVFIDPNDTYLDQDGARLNFTSGSIGHPAIGAGLYRCNYYIPPSEHDSAFFLSSVVASYSNAGGVPNDEIANMFRWYSNNVYYPIFPSIPQGRESVVATSGYNIYSNVSFWTPLAGCVPMKMCSGTIFVSGYMSGSAGIFDNKFLPYQ